MDLKERLDALRALFLATEKEEVKMEEDAPMAEEPAQEAPVVEYVTATQFAELKMQTEDFMKSVTEMLSQAMEMISSTEKNTVPEEVMSKEEEVQEEEVVEMAAEPVVHDPELAVKNGDIKIKLQGGAPQTAEDRARKMFLESLSN